MLDRVDSEAHARCERVYLPVDAQKYQKRHTAKAKLKRPVISMITLEQLNAASSFHFYCSEALAALSLRRSLSLSL